MIEQSITEKKPKLCWKQFEYVNYMTDFFNEHPECEFITFALGRHDTFIAIYRIYEDKNTNIKANS